MAAACGLQCLLLSALVGLVAAAAGPRVNMLTYFDLAVDREPVGRIVFGLFKSTPISAENFRRLCTGEKGFGYKGSRFIKIWPYAGLLGGDITGKGGKSAYNETFFKAEHFRIKHSAPYMLAMNTKLPDFDEALIQNLDFSNYQDMNQKYVGSMFMITTAATPWLDNENVVFGTVLEGQPILDEVKKYMLPKENPKDEKDIGGNPSRDVSIMDAGELPLARPFSTVLGESFPWQALANARGQEPKVTKGGEEYVREQKQKSLTFGLAGPAPAKIEAADKGRVSKATKEGMRRDALNDPALLGALEAEEELENEKAGMIYQPNKQKEAEAEGPPSPPPPSPPAKPARREKPKTSKWEL